MQNTTYAASSISERIQHALTLPPKERLAALKSIRWVLQSPDGSFAILNGTTCCLTSYVDSAIKFDGRDNEQVKAAFWSQQLGCKMVATPL